MAQDRMARVNPIPEGCHSVQPYMMFSGCAQAMEFYAAAFGAREVMCMKSPEGLVQHAEMQIGDSHIMMADDPAAKTTDSPRRGEGSPIILMFYTEDTDAMYARALAAGGTSLREPADQPYGCRMAGVEDPFGYKWWIGTQIAEMSVSEMDQATQTAAGSV